MTDDERRRFESLESLRLAAYNSFNDRRGYEWKFCLSIWTAQAVFLAGLLQPTKPDEKFPLTFPCAWVFAAFIGFLIICLHIYWSNGLARANLVDKKIFLFYDRLMQIMLNVHFTEEIKKEIDELPTTKGWTQWSHLAQVAITTLLAVAVAAIIAVRSS
jgi:hypothetical protein